MTQQTGDDLTQVLIAIARLETKFDSLTNSLPPRIDDHEKRLRTLEKARWPLPSIAVIISLAGLVVSYFSMK